ADPPEFFIFNSFNQLIVVAEALPGLVVEVPFLLYCGFAQYVLSVAAKVRNELVVLEECSSAGHGGSRFAIRLFSIAVVPCGRQAARGSPWCATPILFRWTVAVCWSRPAGFFDHRGLRFTRGRACVERAVFRHGVGIDAELFRRCIMHAEYRRQLR